jgi:hypothetical protein
LIENVKNLNQLLRQVWIDDSLTEEDKKNLESESYSDSRFDTLQLRKKLYDEFLSNQAYTIVKKTDNARIVILTSKNATHQFPNSLWNLWAHIFQWFGAPTSGTHWQVYLYASDVKRTLPESGVIGPDHLNGGYTYPCKSDCIVIYRYEEATRVLIHELLHASCTDNHTNPVEIKEAITESWAELFLVALLSKGDKKRAYHLWNIQDHHIQDLNYTVRTFHNVNSASDYGARYTIMREKVFNDLGIKLNTNYTPKRIRSSRFTSELLHV